MDEINIELDLPSEAQEAANAAYLLMAECQRKLAKAANPEINAPHNRDSFKNIASAFYRYQHAVARELEASLKAKT